eukprot:1685530-Pleurochrysis_carterae.AAC.1
MDGTQRTSVKIDHTVLRVSRGQGRSPTATHGRGFPSTPDTVSVHDRTFRAWRSLRRAVRVATRARGLEEIRKSTQEARGVFFAT